ncbi:CHC2 zinc finger domain-containing protein [Roseburia faecis]|uniref:CHC2 zinc finger domain-containing protein n=1 Tax=Roseburia faecis TaxID=301302 RepID=UPI0031B57902
MANYNKERYEFIEQMFEKLDTVSVDAVVGQYVQLRQQGRHLMGYCPFHQGSHLGSFIVTPDKGLWKCFACGDGYGGNGINFVSKYKGINYLDAAFDIAKDHGLISFDEYEKFANQNYSDNYIRELTERQERKHKKNSPNQVKANAQIIHNVYLCIKENSVLSPDHKETLINERKLSPERIKEDYFTFPIRSKEKIIKKIQEQYPEYSDAILSTVPGFFIKKSTGKLSYSGYKGLGILIRDCNGMIQAIQIRKDTKKEEESRYTWFSSSFASYKPEEFIGGCGSGSPKDVLFPNVDKKHILCITEGRFKSEKLIESGNTSISVQGVTSWKGIEKSISGCLKKIVYSKIYLFFDSDILGNHFLFVQSEKMVRFLQAQFPDITFYYAFWHKKDGKGIDDCINNGNMKTVKFFSVGNATRLVNNCFIELLEKYGIKKFQQLTHEQALQFISDLQNACEQILL